MIQIICTSSFYQHQNISNIHSLANHIIDGNAFVPCDDSSVTTFASFGIQADLSVKHSWDGPATAASPAGNCSRAAETQVQLFLGSAGDPGAFEMVGGNVTFAADTTNNEISKGKPKKGKGKRKESKRR